MAAEALVDLQSATAPGASERLLVEFELGGERYGVDIADIREIIRYQPTTVIPGSPEIVEGIINLRGRVTPIVNLHKRLGMARTEVNDATRIIVIDVEDALVGVHVDAVTGVVTLNPEQVQQLSPEMGSDRSDHLEGVANINGRLIVLINLQLALAGTGMSTDDDEAGPTGESSATPGPATLPDAAAEATEATPIAGASADVEVTADETEAPVETPLTPSSAPHSGIDLGLPLDVLEQSFEAIRSQADQLDALFYAKLFEQHPTLQPLFAATDIQERPGTLLSLLSSAIASVRQSDLLLPQLEALGRGLASHGAEPQHYELVGTVLIETLGAAAGDLWTDEAQAAWSDAITLAAAVMMDAPPEPEAATTTESPLPTAEAPADEPVVEASPAATKSSPKKTTARKPAVKKTTARKPVAKKPAAKKSAAQKPAAKKPAAKARARAQAT